MPSRMTKAAMLLAAFSMAFALVCPVAVTPIFVQGHHSPHVAIELPALLFLAVVVRTVACCRMATEECAPSVSIPERNCALLC